MKYLIAAGVVNSMINMIAFGITGHIFICLFWWAMIMLLLAAYTSCCKQEERDEELCRQREEQLRAKNRKDIYRIQELHAKEQLLRDYNKIKL